MLLRLISREIDLQLRELNFDWCEYRPDNEPCEYPTQALLIKWLRDVHQIVLEVYPDDFYRKEYIRYWVFIHTVGNRRRFGLFEAGIIEALKLIKTND